MLYIVANETAGHYTAGKALGEVRRFLDASGAHYEVESTRYPGHAAELARDAAQRGVSCVYALGGDGTVREVAQGLYGSAVPLGVIPAGTGNDIVKALGLPGDPVGALKASLAAKPRRIDMGLVSGFAFVNVVGTGFDVETVLWTQKFKKYMKGLWPYLLGVIFSMVNHRDVDISLTVDGTEQRLSVLLVAVSNGVCFGGGMKVAPDAEIDDGLLDLLIIRHCPKWKIPFLLPKFISGKVSQLKYAQTMRVRRVVIAREGQIMDVDGELIDMDVADIAIKPGALWVLA